MSNGGTMNWEKIYREKLVTAKEAVATIKSGDIIGISNGTSLAVDIVGALEQRLDELKDITIIGGLLVYPQQFLEKRNKENVRYYTVFMGPYERAGMKHGNIHYIVNQFSRMHTIFREKLRNNVAILECSEPDENGYMSYGPMGATTNHSFKENADKIIVQVNKQTPYLHGTDVHIHVSEAEYICEYSHDLPDFPSPPIGEDDMKIARYITDLIPDGATIQLGIGNIADAVGYLLEKKNDLGVHTEMLTNSYVDLIEKGVITCRKKNFHKDKIVMSFAMGNKKTFTFMNKNKMIEQRPVSYVNDPYIIAKNDNLMSINGTLAVDLTGQVCSESIGFDQFSGTGGQLDFVRGARYSKGGKSFIALKAATNTKHGRVSKICCALPPGSVVTTPRSEVQYIVTEFGIADLFGKDIQERVNAMISIADPGFKDQLRNEAIEAGLIFS
jgi:4-hydroxybutyrate CoA-transferase